MSDIVPNKDGHAGDRVALARVSSLVPVLEELDRRGANGNLLLSQHMMTRSQIADPYREITLARFVAMLEDAAVLAQDDLFCAKVGRQFRPGNLGPVGLIFGASSTLRRGLERLARWLNAWQGGTAVRVYEDNGLLIWSYRIDAKIAARRQDTEMTLGATIALSCDAFGASGRPFEIQVEHAEPADADRLRRIFGVRPLFSQPMNCLIYDVAEADLVHRVEDRDLISILERHVSDLCRSADSDEGLLGRVRTLVLMYLGQRAITLPLLASELNMSARTLQRRLANEGTSLRAIVRDCRLELGRIHLRDGRTSTAEVGRLLGYADNTTFWRAFKAGTGSTPSHYRRT